MSEIAWVAVGSIANAVVALATLLAAWQARAAARSAARSVELQLNATQPWLVTGGGGRDLKGWEIALQSVEGAHWVHAVELLDVTFIPTMPGEQPRTVSVKRSLSPSARVLPGGENAKANGWPAFLDETEWLLFAVDMAVLLGEGQDESQWLPTWRLRVEVSPTKEGHSRRRVALDTRTADPRRRQLFPVSMEAIDNLKEPS